MEVVDIATRANNGQSRNLGEQPARDGKTTDGQRGNYPAVAGLANFKTLPHNGQGEVVEAAFTDLQAEAAKRRNVAPLVDDVAFSMLPGLR